MTMEDLQELKNLTSSTSITSVGKYEKRSLKAIIPPLLAAVISLSCHVHTGIAIGYSAILLPQLDNQTSGIVVTKNEKAWIASVVPLMAPVGAFLSMYMMQRWGRIKALKMAVWPGIIGWIFIALATNVSLLITGRILVAITSTLGTSSGIVYVAEISRKDLRGSLTSTGPCLVSLGLLICYFKGWLLPWRTVAWMSLSYLVVPFILFFFIPESPAWLVLKKRHREALTALQWLHKYQPQPKNHTRTIPEIQFDCLIREQQHKDTDSNSLRNNITKEFLEPTAYKPMIILFGLFFFQQFSGIYIFLFYSVEFFREIGSTMDPYVATIVIGALRVVMTLPTIWLLKKYRRRFLLTLSAVIMSLSILLSGIFTRWIANGTTRLTWVPEIGLLVYMTAAVVGLLTIPWTMTAEMFPLKIRNMGHGICYGLAHVLMFFAVQIYPNLKDAVNGVVGVQWLFAGISGLAVVYVLLFMPETHKKTLSDIEDYFKNNIFYFRQKTTSSSKMDSIKA